jgi:uncharacterized RDD family membrane protein YckC
MDTMLHGSQPHVAPKLRNSAEAAAVGPVGPAYPDIMARTTGSWLSGPEPSDSGPVDQGPNDYPGQRLGLPENGRGSIARFARRMAALMVDWLIAVGLTAFAVPAGLLTRDELLYSIDSRNIALAVWLLLGVLSVRLFGFTPGQYALGLMVVAIDGRPYVGLGRLLVRGVLIALVIPPLFTDADYRGLHDQATRTVVVRR